MKQKRKAHPRTEGLRQLVENRWKHFSWEPSDKAECKRMLPNLSNQVTFTLRAPWSNEAVVKEISRLAQIPIQFLSPELGTTNSFRGKTIFGLAGDEINKVCRNHDDLHWWLSEAGLTIDKITLPPAEDFDIIAGEIVYEMRKSLPVGKYFSNEQHLRIATQLDALKKFTPLQVLPKQCRDELRRLNWKTGKHAITTFEQAVTSLLPKCLHEQMLKRFYRAASTYKRRRKLP